jgi:hypothetical protein
LWGRTEEGGRAVLCVEALVTVDNLIGPRDPPPLPAPTRGAGALGASLQSEGAGLKERSAHHRV